MLRKICLSVFIFMFSNIISAEMCDNKTICHDTLVCQSVAPTPGFTSIHELFFIKYVSKNEIKTIDLLTGSETLAKTISNDVTPTVGAGMERHVSAGNSAGGMPLLTLKYGIEYREHMYNGSVPHRNSLIKGSYMVKAWPGWNQPPAYASITCYGRGELRKMTLMRPERVVN